MIVKLEERKNQILRKSVNLSKQIHIIAANIDPQKAAKNPIAITIATPRPPGQCPTKVVANLTSLSAAPPLSIAIPLKINNGTAMSTCFVRAPKDTWIKTDQGRFNPPIAAIELPKPNTKKIGTEIIKANKDNIDANANI